MLVASIVSVLALAAPVAKALPESDRLRIERLGTGDVLFDQTIPDAPPYETSMFFAEVITWDPHCCLSATALILTRPPGEPPGANPVFVPGTTLVASDVVTFNIWASFPNWVIETFYFDDDDAMFSQLVEFYGSGATLLEKTGELQDVTSLLGSDRGDWRIVIQSTVIPEPGTGLLVTMGLLGLAARRKRRVSRRASCGRAAR
jgi:hypothetical protein